MKNSGITYDEWREALEAAEVIQVVPPDGALNITQLAKDKFHCSESAARRIMKPLVGKSFESVRSGRFVYYWPKKK